jgi:PDZ domain-containing protein
MRRRFLATTLVLLGLLIATTAMAAPAARLFPADTFLYVEADAKALEAGLRQLDLASLIQDPEVKDCLLPALKKLGIDPENPLKDLMGRLPIGAWLDGRVAVGLSGVTVITERPDGTLVRTRIAPDRPLDARLLHEILGMGVSAKLSQILGQPEKPVTLRIQPDALFAVEPGPMTRKFVGQALEQGHPGLKIQPVEIAGRKVLHFTFNPRINREMTLLLEAFADISGDTWIIGTDRDSFTKALEGGPKQSLASSPRFNNVQNRLASSGRVMFAYCDVAQALGMVKTAVAPLLMQELEILGLSSFRGLGMAVSMVDGGVRESYAIVLDGRPRGLFRLLDASPCGLKTANLVPASTIGYFAMKLDLSVLVERHRDLLGELLPGVETFVDPLLSQLSAMSGIDVAGDLLPALGDEVAVLAFPPANAIIPQGVMLVKIRDEARLARVLERAKVLIGQAGLEVRRLPLTDGDEGFYLNIRGAPVQPSFAVRHGYLIGATGAAQLRSFIRDWGKDAAAGTTLADDEVYKKVLAGLGAGNGEKLTGLVFLNLRRMLPPALNIGLPFAGMVPGLDEWIDLPLVPEAMTIANHFSGIAMATQRDGNALTIDFFSPTGIVPLGAAAGWLTYERQMERNRAFMREIEEMQRDLEKTRRELDEPKLDPDGPFVGFNPDTESTGGLRLMGIIEGTPAADAGLKAEDVIVRFNDTPIDSFDDFRKMISTKKAGETVTLGIKRADRMIFYRLRLGRRGDFTDR